MGRARNQDTGSTWSDAKKRFSRMGQTGLLALVHDLYGLSPENRDFLNARTGAAAHPLEPVRYEVEDNLHPHISRNEQKYLRNGKRAIGRRRKNTGDAQGLAELMVTYVEAATRFALDCGDIDNGFYLSLEIVFSEATEQVLCLPSDARETFVDRMARVVKMANRVGREYHNSIQDIYEEAFGEDK